MSSVTIAQFRIDFAEFADTSKYPDSMLTMWLGLANSYVANVERWGALLNQGVELVLAHFVTLSARDRAAAAAGNAPGAPVGLLSSTSTADVSVNYDYASVLVDAAGNWNLTTYGQRYYQLSRMIGAGGLQLGPPCGAPLF